MLVLALSLSVPLLTPWKTLADECIPLLIPLPTIGKKGGGESLGACCVDPQKMAEKLFKETLHKTLSKM
jgi:hypothetical protein